MRKGRPNLDEMKRKFKTIDDFRDFLVKAALQNCTPSDEVSVHAPLGYSGGVSIMDRVDRRRARMRATSSGDDDTRTTAPCSEAIAERVKQAEKRLATRPHELAIFVMFVTMEFSRKTLTAIIDCNKMFPFGYLLLRPYQTYQMCAAILTKSGKETGETLIGHYDFQLSDDVVRKMHYGNFTIYQKAVVYNPKNVLPVPDIWCQGYLGGGGSIFARNQKDASAATNSNMIGESAPSLYACIIGVDEVIKDNPIDVNGCYAEHTGLPSMKTRQYSTCKEYRERHAWMHQE
eukprot:gene33292-42641_t